MENDRWPHVVYVCYSVHAKIGSEKFIHSFCFRWGHPLLLCSMAMPLTLFGEKILNQNISVFKIIFISVAYIPHIFPIMISLLLRNMICWIFRLNFPPPLFLMSWTVESVIWHQTQICEKWLIFSFKVLN